MSTKKDPGAFDCYAKAADDEPMFILLGRDPLAGTLVRAWAQGAEMRITQQPRTDEELEREHAKVRNALQVAAEMEFYCRLQGKVPMRWSTQAPVVTRSGLPRDVLRAVVEAAMAHSSEGRVTFPDTADKIIDTTLSQLNVKVPE